MNELFHPGLKIRGAQKRLPIQAAQKLLNVRVVLAIVALTASGDQIAIAIVTVGT
jgi:hypothetical protein